MFKVIQFQAGTGYKRQFGHRMRFSANSKPQQEQEDDTADLPKSEVEEIEFEASFFIDHYLAPPERFILIHNNASSLGPSCVS